MRVVVTGGRDFENYSAIERALNYVHSEFGPITRLAQGGAPGADRWAVYWAGCHGIRYITYSAQWDLFGPAAGPKRNEEMLQKEQPDLVVAFPGGRGTANCIQLAELLKIQVLKFGEEADE